MLYLSRMNHIYLALAWGVYFFLHSFLASEKVKNFSRCRLGRLMRFYRLAYSVFSSAGLAVVIWIQLGVPPVFQFTLSAGWQIFGTGLVLTGALIIGLAFRKYSFAGFVGFRPDEQDSLRTTGLLGHVRHPIYSGTVLAVLGYVAISPVSTSFVSALCIFIYLPVGIHLEERKLIAKYGDAYVKYRNRVPSIIPKLKPDT